MSRDLPIIVFTLDCSFEFFCGIVFQVERNDLSIEFVLRFRVRPLFEDAHVCFSEKCL